MGAAAPMAPPKGSEQQQEKGREGMNEAERKRKRMVPPSKERSAVK